MVVGTQGIGITAGGNVGKGKGEGTGVTQVNTHVGSSTGNTLISAGGDTTLAGAQVLGKRVELDTNNLTIESRQDTNQYHSKQKDMSAQFTVGAGASVSGSYSQNKVNADYASVNEQSGILAGDGGYQVNVKKHTDLKGGIITSTQAAEDARRNSFSTGTLSASDIQNHADYSASGFSIGGNVDINGGWTGQAANGGTGVNKSIGYGSDSGHDSSVTTSGINTSNISITDVAGQNATGTSVEQIKAQVKTATTTDTVQANSGAIANNFDKDAVQKEIGLQVSVTQQFDNTRQGVKAEINQHIDGLQAELKAAKTSEEKAAIEQKINSWQNVGTLTDMIAGGLSAPTSSALGIATATAAPAVQYQIGQIFKDNQAKNELDKLMTGTAGTRPEEGSALHVLAHTILAASVAAAGGNDALTAGLSAGGAELLAPKVANWLFGNTAGIERDENGDVIASKLTAEQKQTVSNIVSLGAAGLTAGAGGSGSDVVSSSQLAGSAVENNSTDLPFWDEESNKQWAEQQAAVKQIKDGQGIVTNAHDFKLGLNIAVSNSPVLGQIKGVADAIIGKDIITGEDLAALDRALAVIPDARQVKALILEARAAKQVGNIAKAETDLAKASKVLQNYTPKPDISEITGFQGLRRAKPKTPVQGGGGLRSRWKDSKGNIYEWDSQHGALEKYNKNGRHLGEFDYRSGTQTKPADSTRWVEP